MRAGVQVAWCVYTDAAKGHLDSILFSIAGLQAA